jgi:AT-rich DNA-binding protein
MKREKISSNVIRRLPRYLRKLDDLAYNGMDRISSSELGRMMGLTPSQIRQDFSCFGEFGQQGYGYNIDTLRKELSNILGVNCNYNIILIGTGNLGHALIENFGFGGHGFTLLAAFDIKKSLIGTQFAGVSIYDINSLPEFLAENKVDIAVLTSPRRSAHSTAALVASCGVRAIWNFTNIELDLGDPNVLVEDIHFSDSLLTLSYYLTETSANDADEK